MRGVDPVGCVSRGLVLAAGVRRGQGIRAVEAVAIEIVAGESIPGSCGSRGLVLAAGFRRGQGIGRAVEAVAIEIVAGVCGSR